MKERFWVLQSPESMKRLAEWNHDMMDLEQIICPLDEMHMRGGKRITDLNVVLPNLPVQDFVWTWQSELMIQDNVVEFFQEHDVTGYELKPVTARFNTDTGKSPPRLWEVIATGWAGIALPESGIAPEIDCPGCGYLHYSGSIMDPDHLFDERQWDGSDIFIVWPLPRFIMISSRLEKLMRERKFSGVGVRPLTVLKEIGSGFGPGRLSYSMPEERARELGEPLGIY